MPESASERRKLACARCGHTCAFAEVQSAGIEIKCPSCGNINAFAAEISPAYVAYLREQEQTKHHLAETARIIAITDQQETIARQEAQASRHGFLAKLLHFLDVSQPPHLAAV